MNKKVIKLILTILFISVFVFFPSKFSEETKVFLNNQMIEVGKAMMGAGLSMVGEMYDLYETEEGKDLGDRIVH